MNDGNPTSVLVAQEIPGIRLLGMQLAKMDRFALVEHLFRSMQKGHGGWVVTANLDFLRRYVHDRKSKELYDSADIRVADGMPLLWAAWLQGDSLPDRVAGSSLVWLLLERALRDERSVFLLGGAPGANERAREAIRARYPSLSCQGSSPMLSNPPTEQEVKALRQMLDSVQPDLLLVGLGSPKQEYLIHALRPYFPKTWMIGVGVSFSFVAGDLRRAPRWMQKIGAEWIYRMFQDPRRLMRRYLLEDLPFAFRLFPWSFWQRIRGEKGEK